MATSAPLPSRCRRRCPGPVRKPRTFPWSAARQRLPSRPRFRCRTGGSLPTTARGPVHSSPQERYGRLLSAGERRVQCLWRKLYPWVGEDSLSKPLWRRSSSLKRHKGSTSEVPKCRYSFRGCRREDITSRNPHEIRGLERGGKEGKSQRRPYSLQRRNSRAPLVPPKPNEFDMAYSISALRAWLGTRSMPAVSGSGFSKLIVGGRI